MNLAECLCHADIATLRDIARTYELSCSMHSKLQLMQEILYTFRSRDFLSDELERWHQANESVFLRIGLDDRTVFSEEEVAGMFRQQGDVTSQIEKAVSDGWVFPTTRLSGRLQYAIPSELHSEIRKRTISSYFSDLRRSPEGPLIYHDEGVALARDTDIFLQYVSNHDVQLTLEGAMYKRHIVRILELLEIAEEPLEGGWRFGYGRRFFDYPDRLALIYDHAYHMNLIEESPDAYLRVTDRVDDWHVQNTKGKQKSILRFYLSTYRRPISRLPQVVRLMSHADLEQWYSLQDALHAWSNLVNEYYYDSQATVWEERIVKMLRHLGVIRTGSDENSQTWFQTTKLGQELLTRDTLKAGADQERESRRILLVQPNFEVYVTADQPRITAELAIFTDLKQSGALLIYRLSLKSLKRGFESGKDARQVLQFLETFGQTPVPGNVERTIWEWGRELASESQGHEGALSG